MSDTNTITAQRGHVQALAFARKGGVALSALLTGIAKAKGEERLSPLKGFRFLEDTYTDEETHSIPVPGTKMGETGNKPYDKYTSEVKTADGKKKVPGSWYTDAVKATDAFKAASDVIAWCDNEEVEGQTRPDYISKMGTSELRALKKTTKQSIADMRAGLVKSAMLFLHVEDVASLNPARIKVKMPFKAFNNDGTEEIRIISNIIRVLDPAEEIEAKEYTVSEFLALDCDKMRLLPQDQRDSAKLDDTKARGTKGGKKKDTKTQYPIPTSVEQFLNFCNVGGTAVDMETDQGQKLNAGLLAAIAGKKVDVIETIGDFLMKVDGLWTQIQPFYMQIKSDKASAQAAAATAAKGGKVA